MATQVEVEDVGNTDIDNAEEALVTFLELALVEDLDGNHRRILDRAGKESNRTQLGKSKVEYGSDENGERKLTCRNSHSSTG